MSRIKDWLIGKKTKKMDKKTEMLRAETEKLIERAYSDLDFLTQLRKEYKTEIDKLVKEDKEWS